MPWALWGTRIAFKSSLTPWYLAPGLMFTWLLSNWEGGRWEEEDACVCLPKYPVRSDLLSGNLILLFLLIKSTSGKCRKHYACYFYENTLKIIFVKWSLSKQKRPLQDTLSKSHVLSQEVVIITSLVLFFLPSWTFPKKGTINTKSYLHWNLSLSFVSVWETWRIVCDN